MKRNLGQTLLTLLVAAAVITLIIFQQRQAPATKFPGQMQLPSGWVKFENCRLLPERSNDGDSFLVGHDGGSDTFRLYFVDCPEKESWHGQTDRLQDQARYFSLPSTEAAALVGRAAEAFTQRLLAKPFTVLTKWERVYDSRRFYAQVIVPTADDGPQDLANLLVREGYARIHTKGTRLPGRMSEEQIKAMLHRLESASKAEHRGAWKK